MKIRIQTGAQTIRIPIPTGLLLHPRTLRMFCKCFPTGPQAGGLANFFQSVPEEALEAICRELRRIRRQRGSWNLAEIEAQDGTTIQIRI